MKYFKTLRDVPCFMGHEFKRISEHFLPHGLDYHTTDAMYDENGNFIFELWDEEGYIASYVILKHNLDLIEEIKDEIVDNLLATV